MFENLFFVFPACFHQCRWFKKRLQQSSAGVEQLTRLCDSLECAREEAWSVQGRRFLAKWLKDTGKEPTNGYSKNKPTGMVYTNYLWCFLGGGLFL